MSRSKERRKSSSGGFPALLGKLGKLAKVFKAAKFLKPLITVGSLVISTVAYAFTLPGGWIFAIGFVLMILVHEMGHVMALRRKGFRASAPVFIPFVGAAIFAPKLGSRDEEAYIGYAGPLIGGSAAIALLAVVAFSSHPPVILSLVAYTALFINVFNLIPISPFDGGRVTQAVGPWFKWVGAVLMVALTVAMKNPGLIFLWLIALGNFPMKNWVRAQLAVLIWGIMAFMELDGIGVYEGLFWIIFDLVIGFIFVAAYRIAAKQPDGLPEDNRPQLEGKRKLFWLGMYALLAIALIGFMIISHNYLPTQVTHN